MVMATVMCFTSNTLLGAPLVLLLDPAHIYASYHPLSSVSKVLQPICIGSSRFDELEPSFLSHGPVREVDDLLPVLTLAVTIYSNLPFLLKSVYII